jgi:hypothetical protein
MLLTAQDCRADACIPWYNAGCKCPREAGTSGGVTLGMES